MYVSMIRRVTLWTIDLPTATVDIAAATDPPRNIKSMDQKPTIVARARKHIVLNDRVARVLNEISRSGENSERR